MLASITSKQFTEWLAFAELEPFGSERDDYRAGVVASAVYNANPFRGKGSPPVKPADLFATLRPPLRRMTAAQIHAQLRPLVRRKPPARR